MRIGMAKPTKIELDCPSSEGENLKLYWEGGSPHVIGYNQGGYDSISFPVEGLIAALRKVGFVITLEVLPLPPDS